MIFKGSTATASVSLPRISRQRVRLPLCNATGHRHRPDVIRRHSMYASPHSSNTTPNLADPPSGWAPIRPRPTNLPTSRRGDPNLAHSIPRSEPSRPLPRPGDLDQWSARLHLPLAKYRYRLHGHGHRLLPARRHRYRGYPHYPPRLCPTVSSGHANFYVTSRITAGLPQYAYLMLTYYISIIFCYPPKKCSEESDACN